MYLNWCSDCDGTKVGDLEIMFAPEESILPFESLITTKVLLIPGYAMSSQNCQLGPASQPNILQITHRAWAGRNSLKPGE